MTYVWDFGSLSEEVEFKYIKNIISDIQFFEHIKVDEERQSKKDIVVKIISLSHKFIKSLEDQSSASLRDIARFKKLYIWFLKSL